MTTSSAYRMPNWLILIACMTAIGPVSIDLYVPGFEAISADLHERGVERTMAAYLFGIAVGQLFYGPISDRFGRKPPLYFGFVVYTLGSIGCAFAQNMTQLICCRILQALGSGSALAIGRAIVRDRCEPQEAARAFSTLMTIVSLAPIVAPAAGGWLIGVFGWRAAFVLQALAGVGVLIAMHFVLTESRDPAHVQPLAPSQILRTYGSLFSDRPFIGYSVLSACIMASLFSYVSGAPTVLTATYGLSPQQFGMLIGLNGCSFFLASRLNIRALHRALPQTILNRYIWGPVVFGLALVALTLAMHPALAAIVLLQFCLFVCCGRILPNVAALALAHHGRNAGSASALMGSLQSLGPTAAGLVIAQVNNGTLLPLFIAMSLCAALALMAYRYAVSAQRGVANT